MMNRNNIFVTGVFLAGLFQASSLTASHRQRFIDRNLNNISPHLINQTSALFNEGYTLPQALEKARSNERVNLVMQAAAVASDTTRDTHQKLSDLMQLADHPPGFIPTPFRQAEQASVSASANIFVNIENFKTKIASQLDELMVDKRVLENLQTQLEESLRRNTGVENPAPVQTAAARTPSQPAMPFQTPPSTPPVNLFPSTPASSAPSAPAVYTASASSTSNSELEMLRKQIAELNEIIIKLTGKPVESAHGTPVWLSLRSPSFIHMDKLKKNPVINTDALDKAFKELENFYVTHIKDHISGIFRNLAQSLNRIDDIDSYEEIISNEANIRTAVSKIRIMDTVTRREDVSRKNQTLRHFEGLFETAKEKYLNYSSERATKVIEGLDDYTKVQQVYAAVANQVDEQEYHKFMDLFHQKKDTFKQHLIVLADTTTPAACHKLLDALELEFGSTLFPTFISTFGKEPSDQSVKNYNELPFILMWKATGTGAYFNDLLITNKKRYNRLTQKEEISVPGLENEYQFNILRNTYPAWGAEIEFVEKVFMMRHLIKRWNNHKINFSPSSIAQIKALSLKMAPGSYKPLLPQEAKDQLVKIYEKGDEILDESLSAQCGIVKTLDDYLKPALLSQNRQAWTAGNQLAMREELRELYQVYTGLFKYAKELYAKNPRIKEFHEE